MKNNKTKGIVYTPNWCIDLMLNTISKDEWCDSTVLDMCAGHGQFSKRLPSNIASVTGVELRQECYDSLVETCDNVIIDNVFNIREYFDVVVCNPPYQKEIKGYKRSASAYYPEFVSHALEISNRFILFIIPARWYSGGKGTNKFRKMMLSRTDIRELHDFKDCKIFKDVNIAGGICFFLIDKQHNGKCKVVNYGKHCTPISTSYRYIKNDNSNIFIRDNRDAILIDNMFKYPQKTLDEVVIESKPFGLRTFFTGGLTSSASSETIAGSSTQNELTYNENQAQSINSGGEKSAINNIKVYRKKGVGYCCIDDITKNTELINKWKVLTSAVSSTKKVLGHTFIAEPGSACSETYIVIDCFDDLESAYDCFDYLIQKRTRHLISIGKISQHTTRKVFKFVPYDL